MSCTYIDKHQQYFVNTASLLFYRPCQAGSFAMSPQPQLKFNNGHSVPQIGFGCFAYSESRDSKEAAEFTAKCKAAVEAAVAAGYRHFDTAMMYRNEKVVGEVIKAAIASGKAKREEFFVTSKIAPMCMAYDNAKAAVDWIVKTLDLGYVDMILIHHPISFTAVKPADILDLPKDDFMTRGTAETDYMETWKALEEGVNAGKVRSIGVSNFNHVQIQRVLDEGTIKPVTNQVECHPALPQEKLSSWMRERGITLTAYGPLQNASIFQNKLGLLEQKPIVDAAKAHGKTPAQAALRWNLQRGNIIIPKSSNPGRMQQNLDILDFELTKEEMAAIATLDKGPEGRLFSGGNEARMKHKNYPFNEPF